MVQCTAGTGQIQNGSGASCIMLENKEMFKKAKGWEYVKGHRCQPKIVYIK